MIQKIQASEYLKRLDNMTAEEKGNYTKRVGEWLEKQLSLLTPKMEEESARFLNVIQCSASWNDEECCAWTDGARLLTALVHTGETWLPDMLYVKSAKRAIRQMVEALWDIDHSPLTIDHSPLTIDHSPLTIDHSPLTIDHGATFRGNAAHGAVAGGNHKGEAKVTVNDQCSMVNDLVPARPTHIDQYVHLLPKKTQEHAALVQGLYRELEDARQKMQLLMDDPTASPKDRETWAKKATKCDNTLRKIFDELDAEWEKLVKSGRVVVDDLGNARVMTIDHSPLTIDHSPLTIDHSPLTIDHSEPAELTSEQKARRRELRKFLVDTRRGNGATREEYVKKWNANFKEYAKLEGDAAYQDEKILEAAKHYEIILK